MFCVDLQAPLQPYLFTSARSTVLTYEDGVGVFKLLLVFCLTIRVTSLVLPDKTKAYSCNCFYKASADS